MLVVSRSTFATIRNFALTLGGAIAVLAACSSEPAATPAGPAPCDSAKCAPGNQCLPLNGETKCRKTCSSNAEPATSCPFGYTCVDTLVEGVSPFCVQDTAVRDDGKPIEKKPSGQWGAKCQADLTQAELRNPGCDGEQGFLCYGVSPTDPNAYCTRYGCTQDSDCGAGFWCGKTNHQPNATTTKRTIGQVDTVCLRRTYCSTCKADLDCPPVLGKPQHCVDDGEGKEKFCAPECDTSQACNSEAQCLALGDVKVCYPRAKVCVGDGSLCSPCRVDTDCGDDGACVKGQYTTEKSCAKKAPSSCGTEDAPAKGGCVDKVEGGSNAQVRCLGVFFEQVPKDYCHGLYAIGAEGGDIGCYTPAKK